VFLLSYKKILPNQNIRFKILSLIKYLPDALVISIQYWLKLSRIPNIKNPKRFSEKLQWYKLYYRNSLFTECADKYSVRNYVKSKGLEITLNSLIGVYDTFNDIEFEKLPEKFVMKTTNGSGTNILCKDKSEFDVIDAKRKIEKWLRRDIYASGREWSYKNIKPRIIIENFLEDKTNQYEDLNDYKFFCFNGKIEFIVLDVDRQIAHKRNVYDANWNYINVSTDYPNFKDVVTKPNEFDEMSNIAYKLSDGIPFVRVDLYLVNSKIFFGELTFYPWTGYVNFTPDKFDYELGDKFILPTKYSEKKI
jgi:hypothetical protein